MAKAWTTPPRPLAGIPPTDLLGIRLVRLEVSKLVIFERVHGGGHAAPGGLDEVTDLGDECRQIAGLGLGGGGSFGGSGFLFH